MLHSSTKISLRQFDLDLTISSDLTIVGFYARWVTEIFFIIIAGTSS